MRATTTTITKSLLWTPPCHGGGACGAMMSFRIFLGDNVFGHPCQTCLCRITINPFNMVRKQEANPILDWSLPGSTISASGVEFRRVWKNNHREDQSILGLKIMSLWPVIINWKIIKQGYLKGMFEKVMGIET